MPRKKASQKKSAHANDCRAAKKLKNAAFDKAAREADALVCQTMRALEQHQEIVDRTYQPSSESDESVYGSDESSDSDEVEEYYYQFDDVPFVDTVCARCVQVGSAECEEHMDARTRMLRNRLELINAQIELSALDLITCGGLVCEECCPRA